MLEKYNCRTADDYRNALKEIIQEISLLGLYRCKAFDKAAFYGGTALRIFYGLDRFSEDLDFSLLKPDGNFDITPWCKYIEEELASFGFETEVDRKKKNNLSNIESAFIKGETLIHILKITSLSPPVSGIPPKELLKIKIEIDTNPPMGAGYEIKYQINPIPYHIRIYNSESLFAGKIHALLCREWKSRRIKGRDLYDYLWYIGNKTAINIDHLEKRMIQSGHWNSSEKLDLKKLEELLYEKFDIIDYRNAKNDITPFIKDLRKIELWGNDFFRSITSGNLKAV